MRACAVALVAACALACALASAAAAQDSTFHLRAPGPTVAEQIVEQTLAHRYIVRYEQYNTPLFRDSVFDTTVVVVNSDATVASTVHGDVVVINGDLFLQPGARIDGRAVAIGGGVYDSQQAKVGGDKLSFRDVHFDTARTTSGVDLVYRVPPPPQDTIPTFGLPGLFGLRLPLYDRVDGLSLPWGPRITLADTRLVIDPTITYRSNLGAYDLAATVRAQIGGGWSATGFAGKTTLTNDRWIQSDLANSISTLGVGSDYRNYWRAARYEGALAREWQFSQGDLRLSAGGRTEDDWSVRGGGPWSLFNQNDSLHMKRPNPGVERGRLSSALFGAHGSWQRENVALEARADVEVVLDAPSNERFTQTTIFARAAFPTFVTRLGTQTFVFHTHMVLTSGDTAPPQRFAYLGGGGTLPTLDVLSRGGDQLIFLEGLYNFPIQTLHVPFLGTPIITVREMLGSTGIGSLGRFDSNIGGRLTLGLFSGEIFVNPANGDHVFSLGLSLLR
ncbi:MAG: hypothetical protein JJD97_14295 [Gemmatimonadaceae bacterium]|nr:hypothetical protein [Gemmatimonadaceae bacterium]